MKYRLPITQTNCFYSLRHIHFVFLFCLMATSVQPAHSQQENKEIKSAIGNYLTSVVKSKVSTGRVTVEEIKDTAGTLKIYCSETLADAPVRPSDIDRIYGHIKSMLPDNYKDRKVEIYTISQELRDYVPLYYRGKTPGSSTARFTRPDGIPLIQNISQPYHPDRGLSGRHIAIWPSHGRYYEPKLTRWEWQRARMFQTVEDLYTRSYVMPFLVPMLEKAGANILIPRERDTQTEEIIVDNDAGLNTTSLYDEKNGTESWQKGTPGFAWKKAVYKDFDNPFADGSFSNVKAIKRGNASVAEWMPEIKKEGDYAVYISYRTLPNSIDDADYTVVHNGITTNFKVNQKMGGGTWIYLGTFHFAKGKSRNNMISLTNLSRTKNGVVTADAIRLGGGMGNIARHNAPQDSLKRGYQYITSGYPRYTEGARYYMQWAGVPDSVYSPTHGVNDYNDDYLDRGLWVNWLAGGSSVYPDGKGLNIPIDMSMAFHSNAGTYKDDRIYGTLAIYSDKGYNGKFYNGAPRFLSHDLSDLIATNIVNDIRRSFAPEWRRLGNWNKPYYEAWEPRVPAMLLELLSHQNFADMRYGLDPRFRFTVSRAVYKGMLQFMSSMYGTDYTIEPLAPTHFCTRFAAARTNLVILSWHPQHDSIETSKAEPEAYILYMRKGAGDFDNGRVVKDTTITLAIPADTICSFKVTAINRGGESFPSEVLAVGRTKSSITNYYDPNKPVGKRSKMSKQQTKNNATAEEDKVMLIINGFKRLSAPASFTAPAPADTALAGFLDEEDHGVPYIQDFSYIGSQKEFRRALPWYDDDSGGFGDSYGDYEAAPVAGNTFDYPYLHGTSVMKAGWSFVSAGSDAIEAGDLQMTDYKYADLILGKQMQTRMGKGGYYPIQYKTFPTALQQAITAFTSAGGSLFTSGAYVATDLWCHPFVPSLKADRDFLTNTLHYKWRNRRAARIGEVKSVDSPAPVFSGNYTFRTKPNPEMYVVEAPDGIEPADSAGFTIMRYSENNLSAAVAWKGNYRTVTLGFPFETIQDAAARDSLMKEVITFFTSRK